VPSIRLRQFEDSIVDFEQSLGDMNVEIGMDANQVGVEGGVVDLGQRSAIRDDWLTKLLIRIENDVGRVE
jgi:hypothetical protein